MKDTGFPISLEKAKKLNGKLIFIRGVFLAEPCVLKSCQKEVLMRRLGFITIFTEASLSFIMEQLTERNPEVPRSQGIRPESRVYSIEELKATPQLDGATVIVEGFVCNKSTPKLISQFSTEAPMIFFGKSEFSVPEYQKYH